MKNTSVKLCVVVLLCFSFVLTLSAPESALVTQLPGFNGTFPSKHYSGYVTVDPDHGRNLFYYFVESEGDPAEDPVVLWLNGGPGCSSFDGFVYEHGPFNFEKATTPGGLPKLHLNPYSWSKVSSVIYLDSPAGVGFSYSKNLSDYSTSDSKTAADSHTFLLKWFELYPEFLSNPFYISGESYGGIYVPTLAYEVVKGIEAGVEPILNLKGYLVGNGVTDDEFEGYNTLVPFAHGMGLISNDLYEEARRACHGNFSNWNDGTCGSEINKVVQRLDGLNMYNILEPCYHQTDAWKSSISKTRLPPSFRMLEKSKRPLAAKTRMFGHAWPFRAIVRDGLVPTWPELLSVPCTDDSVATSWLNDGGVRKALHVAEKSLVSSWELCSLIVGASYVFDAKSMIQFHKSLTAKGYRGLIYSGDHDMQVPYIGSEAWTRAVGYKIVDEWRAWFSNGQVAGYIQGYDHDLTFLTIKGAGHMVPQYKPREALDFYSRFLAGQKI